MNTIVEPHLSLHRASMRSFHSFSGPTAGKGDLSCIELAPDPFVDLPKRTVQTTISLTPFSPSHAFQTFPRSKTERTRSFRLDYKECSTLEQIIRCYIDFDLISRFKTPQIMPELCSEGRTSSLPVRLHPNLHHPKLSPSYRTQAKLPGLKRERKKQKPDSFDKGDRSRSETGYLGVRFSTNGRRFRATVNYDKKSINVGTFDTAREAAEQYDLKILEVTGGNVESSRLNFPEKWMGRRDSCSLSPGSVDQYLGDRLRLQNRLKRTMEDGFEPPSKRLKF